MQKFKLATLNVLLYTRSGAKCTYDTLAFSWRNVNLRYRTIFVIFLLSGLLHTHTHTHTHTHPHSAIMKRCKIGLASRSMFAGVATKLSSQMNPCIWQWRSQGLPRWASRPPGRLKMRKKTKKNWGKMREATGKWGKIEEIILSCTTGSKRLVTALVFG